MESQLYYKRSIRVLAKALEQPSQSTDTDATPNDDKTRRSKRLAIRNDPLPEEQVEAQIVDPLHFNKTIPTELFFIIMNLLEVWDQFTMRRVCRSWKAKIEKMLKKFPKKCLKLNVKKKSPMVEQAEPVSRCVRTWEPNESIRRMVFEFVYMEPEISEQTQISIWDKAFHSDAARIIGRAFSKVKTLIIYWDTEDSEQNIDNLLLLFSQFSPFFNDLNTFGLIVSGDVTNPETMSKICDKLHSQNLGPFNQLYLMIPEGIQTPSEQEGQVPTIHRYPILKLNQATQFFSSFCITAFQPIGSILKTICDGQKLANTTDLKRLVRPLESLCFPFNGDSQQYILGVLELNKDVFASVKRLVLWNIWPREAALKLLEYFPNLEQLSLNVFNSLFETFGPNWIGALQPMTKLTELSLFNFHFERKRVHWGWGPRRVIDEISNLSQVRKLTVASPNLFFHLRKASNPAGTKFMPQLVPEDIGDTINMRFPGLQELNMWSGDAEIHNTQTPKFRWQTLEQSLNRDLPPSLPLLPGLRVNIQLRHPAMYNIFLARPANVKSQLTEIIADSEHCRRNPNFASMNRLIELRQPPAIVVHQGFANGLLVAKAFCESMRDRITEHYQARESGQQQLNLGNDQLVEGSFIAIIRALQIQIRGMRRSNPRIQIGEKAIRDILRIIKLRRELVAQFAREQAQAQPNPNEPNPNEPNPNEPNPNEPIHNEPNPNELNLNEPNPNEPNPNEPNPNEPNPNEPNPNEPNPNEPNPNEPNPNEPNPNEPNPNEPNPNEPNPNEPVPNEPDQN